MFQTGYSSFVLAPVIVSSKVEIALLAEGEEALCVKCQPTANKTILT